MLKRPLKRRYGKLTVIRTEMRMTGKRPRPITMVLVRCKCGVKKWVIPSHLNNGSNTSCGALGCRGKHHQSSSKTYGSWNAMLQRCYGETHPAYANYGGRGITVCLGWRIDFRNFLRDMGERPDEMTLDRKDNNLGYSKNNCRWATSEEQGQNRRNIVYVEFEGRTQTIQQWAKEKSINFQTLHTRIRRSRWDLKRAMCR
jgi:hypothetical protein